MGLLSSYGQVAPSSVRPLPQAPTSKPPLDLEPMPADEGARMMWWAVRLLRQTGNSDFALRLSKISDALK